MPATPLLTLEKLAFQYPQGASFKLAKWQLPAKAQALIFGPSGCGKTTLLHLLTGVLPLQQGEVTLLGQNLRQLTPTAFDQFRGQKIGVVMQNFHLIPALTVTENLALALRLAGQAPNPERVDTLLKKLGVQAVAKALPHQLSQGQAQRVAIARALVHSPQLIVADEPTSALDDKNCNQVRDLLQREADDAGVGLIVVSHDSRLRADFPHQLDLGKVK